MKIKNRNLSVIRNKRRDWTRRSNVRLGVHTSSLSPWTEVLDLWVNKYRRNHAYEMLESSPSLKPYQTVKTLLEDLPYERSTRTKRGTEDVVCLTQPPSPNSTDPRPRTFRPDAETEPRKVETLTFGCRRRSRKLKWKSRPSPTKQVEAF